MITESSDFRPPLDGNLIMGYETMAKVYNQVINKHGESFRHAWVINTLQELRFKTLENTLFDVGAGLCPYKNFATKIGFRYISHDFGGYSPGDFNQEKGLHSSSWNYPEHDFKCDILEIPDSVNADLVLCTEVLEHVPDPIRVFNKLSRIVKPGGYLIFTVPFSSLMHQAPYWFQSGLSPFWFHYWAKEFKIEIIELTVYGDYIDQMNLEMERLFPISRYFSLVTKATSWLAEKYRRVLSDEVLSSGGIGVLFLGKRI